MPPKRARCSLTKRFPIKQKNKVRPIDDYNANVVYYSVTQKERVAVHTIDHIASLVANGPKASQRCKPIAGTCGMLKNRFRLQMVRMKDMHAWQNLLVAVVKQQNMHIK